MLFECSYEQSFIQFVQQNVKMTWYSYVFNMFWCMYYKSKYNIFGFGCFPILNIKIISVGIGMFY